MFRVADSSCCSNQKVLDAFAVRRNVHKLGKYVRCWHNVVRCWHNRWINRLLSTPVRYMVTVSRCGVEYAKKWRPNSVTSELHDKLRYISGSWVVDKARMVHEWSSRKHRTSDRWVRRGQRKDDIRLISSTGGKFWIYNEAREANWICQSASWVLHSLWMELPSMENSTRLTNLSRIRWRWETVDGYAFHTRIDGSVPSTASKTWHELLAFVCTICRLLQHLKTRLRF